ncbi:MAG: ThuA domain-containing protein [bacterium]|nr:ThuA domain-containing protein [bacterium]
MRPLIRLFLLGLAVAAASLAAVHAAPVVRLNILLIDGQNNHQWRATTPVIKEMLEKTGRFAVTVATTPPKGAPTADWEAFHPDFTKYAAVFSNYNGEDWPEPVRQDFERYMANGGGLVVFHAANNPFPKWDEWNKMVGLAWQPATFGDRIIVDDATGRMIRTPKGEGPGAGHGPQHPYEVKLRDAAHPVTQGMPARWPHLADELYHGQRGPAVNMHILATAYDDPAGKGTGAHEPMVYTVSYGKGRVFVNLMGHAAAQTAAPDMVALLTRGTEWAATGKVTLPLPTDFTATPAPFGR